MARKFQQLTETWKGHEEASRDAASNLAMYTGLQPKSLPRCCRASRDSPFRNQAKMWAGMIAQA